MAHAPRTVPLTQPLTYLWRPVQGEETAPRVIEGRRGRGAKKWFSFDMPVDAARPMALIITYPGEEQQTRTIEILVEGSRVGEQTIERHRPGSPTKSVFDVEYAIPADLTRGKETATVFGVRLIRTDE